MKQHHLTSLKQIMFPKVWETDKFIRIENEKKVTVDNRWRSKINHAHKRVKKTTPIKVSENHCVKHTYTSSLEFHCLRTKRLNLEKRMKKLNLQQYYIPMQQVEQLFIKLWDMQLND